MSTPIEVIVCTFNRSAQLDACLATMAKQTAPHETWRVTVVDNGSTDNTAAVIERHEKAGHLPGLRRILEVRAGLQEARRCGLSTATDRWCAFVDDDCHLEPDWIAAAQRAVVAYPGAGAFGGRVTIEWGMLVPTALLRNGWLFAEQNHGEKPKEVSALVGTGLVVDREALAATGWMAAPLVPDRVGRDVTSGGDVEITQRLAASGRGLRYEPAMQLFHRIDRGRLTPLSVLRLSGGLGAGAALITVMNVKLEEVAAEEVKARSDLRLHWRSLFRAVRRGELFDWRIQRAFLVARQRRLARICSDPAELERLAGAILRRDEPEG